jgi:response regulator RpfG family c-di-GMP phosphodiesterase
MEKDFISLLFVSDEKNDAQTQLFSKANGFITQVCSSVKQGVHQAEKTLPDIILIDKPISLERADELSLEQCIRLFDQIPFRFKPAFFLGVDAYPTVDSRMTYHGFGFDEFIIRPLSVRDVYHRSGIYLEKKMLAQQQIAREETLEKSFSYLDKFKLELKTVKTELIQEKSSLNNALKQIHHMTRERNQMKKSLLLLKESLGRNMTGFERLLSALIKTRIEVNRGHADRVAHIVDFIAKQLNFDEKKLEDLRKAAMLHEIGLLFMPEQAFEKEEKEFTRYENNILIQYPVKGADLLKECQGFEPAAQIIRSLNENSDGTGFPDGLKKRVIPLASRILAGADAFDRLKDSPKVDCLERMLDGLEKLAGSRLDPVIVGWLEKYALFHMGSDAYRVRGVGVEQLEPGMRLGTALFTTSGTKLFSVNTALTQESIEKIIQYHREYPVDEIIYIKA